MQFPPADISSLFAQLGLAHCDEAIAYFIDAHRPLPGCVPLTAAPFWTRPQSELLRQGGTGFGRRRRAKAEREEETA